MHISGDTDFFFAPISEQDGEDIIRLFNYYIAHSFAAFMESPVSSSFFEQMKPLLGKYPTIVVKNEIGNLVGFGLTRPYNSMPTFYHTAIISYFIDPGFTGKGIGTIVLKFLEEELGKKGIKNILAEISSRNEGSIRFHTRHGFTHQGRFVGVGIKNGALFDTIWMQKVIG